MSWRTVVISKPAKLDLRLGFMVVRSSDETVKIHISEISIVLIESTMCSVTTALMSELVKNKIKVIFCDEKQNPHAELVSFYGCHDSSLKIKRQMQWETVRKQSVWTEIVAQKIKKQAQTLSHFRLREERLLNDYLQQLEFNDATNREGHAAKVYFNALFGKSFSRSDDTATNAALNYGYSILLSCFNREVVNNGYLTQLGLFHDNMFNPFNLSCDLMEPFRPIIDRCVKNAAFEAFGTNEKRQILSLLQTEVMIDGRKQLLTAAIKIYTKSVLDAVESGEVAGIRFYQYEL